MFGLVVCCVLLCGFASAVELRERVDLKRADLLNGWEPRLGTNSEQIEPPSFWKDDVFVSLQGSISPTSGSINDTIFTLPFGFRPSVPHRFIVTTAADDFHSVFQNLWLVLSVGVDGNVSATSNDHVTSLSLDSVRFTYQYIDDLGASRDTSESHFSDIDLTAEGTSVAAIAGLNPPQAFRDSQTGFVHIRGSATLLRTDCNNPKAGSCDLFLLDSSVVPTGFASETAVFPQLNDPSGSYVLVYSADPNARARLYRGSVGDVVYLDGIVLLPTVVEIAQQQPTEQSSTGSNGFSNLAVDGDTSADFSEGSCVLTNVGTTTPALATEFPWWYVDVGEGAVINFVRISARSDCCGESMADFQIRIGDDSNVISNALCGENLYVAQGATTDFSCPMTGRYISIHLTSRDNPLTFCEVQVFSATNVSPQGQSMHQIELSTSSIVGGWTEYTTTSTARAHRTPDGTVCLAGRAVFSPITTHFNGRVVGVIAEGWRPLYIYKRPVACYTNDEAQICVLTIYPSGQIVATNGDRPPEAPVADANWLSLEGFCYDGSVVLTSVDVSGTTGGVVLEHGASFELGTCVDC